MEKFVPYEKLSKKQRRAVDANRREMWSISPVTRRPENPRAYKREKTRKRMFDDSSSVSFCLMRKAGF
ncbi:MAG: hypothetical protein IJQ02_03125 [Oscillospiraceae bacterium]|nr:hypothetical protein [Oscillospiraceae bacterium]